MDECDMAAMERRSEEMESTQQAKSIDLDCDRRRVLELAESLRGAALWLRKRIGECYGQPMMAEVQRALVAQRE
jgi:hypothetical protein